MFYSDNRFLRSCARKGLFPLALLTICLVPIAAISAPVVYFSTEGDDAVPGVAGPFDDADIYSWDSGSGTFSRIFDASAGGFPTNADVDGLQVVAPDKFYLSFRKNKGTNLPGIGKVQDEDIVLYEVGVLSMYLDGSDVGLADNNGEDIDALAVLDDGSIVVSTYSTPRLPGVSGLADEDLVRCAGAFGDDSSCTWELYFDGSDVGLSNSRGTDTDAASVSGDTITLSTLGSFNVSGLSGNKADIFECTSATTGANTVCGAFSMLLDGDAYGLSGNIDAISVTGAGVPPSSPTAVDDLNNSTNDGIPVNVDVLANDRDGPAPIDPATVTILDQPSKGSATALTDGSVDYAPTPGETGQDSFTYTVDDEQGQTSNLATVQVTIESIGGGDPGIVTPISPSGVVTTRTPAYTWLPDPNANRYKVRVNDNTGAKKINTWYTATEAGCASGHGTCSVTPAYQLADGAGSWKVKAANDSFVAPYSDLLLFNVSIGGGNMAPISNDDTATVGEGTTVAIDVAANDTDPDGTINPASISIIGNPSHGTIDAVNDTGTIAYTADAPYSGPDSFTYTINDNQGLTSNEATVRISVTGFSETSLVFVGDFENGFDGWDLTELCCDHSLNLIDTPTRVGNGAARFQILRDDTLVAGANRAELKLDNDALETEYWYGWSTMLPSDWAIDTSLEIIAQFHLPSGSGGPPLRFKTDGENLVINTKTLKDGKDVRKTVFSEQIVSSTMKGSWTDFIVNVIWTTGDQGHLRIWINGEQVVDEPGSTNFIDTSAPYFKIGLYKTAWRDNKPSMVDSRVIYHDEVRVARGPNGYTLVHPASQ